MEYVNCDEEVENHDPNSVDCSFDWITTPQVLDLPQNIVDELPSLMKPLLENRYCSVVDIKSTAFVRYHSNEKKDDVKALNHFLAYLKNPKEVAKYQVEQFDKITAARKFRAEINAEAKLKEGHGRAHPDDHVLGAFAEGEKRGTVVVGASVAQVLTMTSFSVGYGITAAAAFANLKPERSFDQRMMDDLVAEWTSAPSKHDETLTPTKAIGAIEIIKQLSMESGKTPLELARELYDKKSYASSQADAAASKARNSAEARSKSSVSSSTAAKAVPKSSPSPSSVAPSLSVSPPSVSPASSTSPLSSPNSASVISSTTLSLPSLQPLPLPSPPTSSVKSSSSRSSSCNTINLSNSNYNHTAKIKVLQLLDATEIVEAGHVWIDATDDPRNAGIHTNPNDPIIISKFFATLAIIKALESLVHNISTSALRILFSKYGLAPRWKNDNNDYSYEENAPTKGCWKRVTEKERLAYIRENTLDISHLFPGQPSVLFIKNFLGTGKPAIVFFSPHPCTLNMRKNDSIKNLKAARALLLIDRLIGDLFPQTEDEKMKSKSDHRLLKCGSDSPSSCYCSSTTSVEVVTVPQLAGSLKEVKNSSTTKEYSDKDDPSKKYRSTTTISNISSPTAVPKSGTVTSTIRKIVALAESDLVPSPAHITTSTTTTVTDTFTKLTANNKTTTTTTTVRIACPNIKDSTFLSKEVYYSEKMQYFYAQLGSEIWLEVVKLRSQELLRLQEGGKLYEYWDLSERVRAYLAKWKINHLEFPGISLLFRVLSAKSSRQVYYYSAIEEKLELESEGVRIAWTNREEDVSNFEFAKISNHWNNTFRKGGLSEEEIHSSKVFRIFQEVESAKRGQLIHQYSAEFLYSASKSFHAGGQLAQHVHWIHAAQDDLRFRLGNHVTFKKNNCTISLRARPDCHSYKDPPTSAHYLVDRSKCGVNGCGNYGKPGCLLPYLEAVPRIRELFPEEYDDIYVAWVGALKRDGDRKGAQTDIAQLYYEKFQEESRASGKPILNRAIDEEWLEKEGHKKFKAAGGLI